MGPVFPSTPSSPHTNTPTLQHEGRAPAVCPRSVSPPSRLRLTMKRNARNAAPPPLFLLLQPHLQPRSPLLLLQQPQRHSSLIPPPSPPHALVTTRSNSVMRSAARSPSVSPYCVCWPPSYCPSMYRLH